jgi:hypothetical protein
MKFIKNSLAISFLFSLVVGCNLKQEKTTDNTISSEITITKDQLLDKIKGGWAGQVIGCSYGGPTEFKYNGSMINDYLPIPWTENTMEWWFKNAPGLYDDVYMDLTFVDIFEKHGLNAPDSLHALAFANAEYPLWHANQAARYNILNGMMPPASGLWKNNPHADDIDFQIESDFAGLMSPGMVRSASEIANKIGHIMNYGDGVYGGIYVASMYSLAFIYNDMEFIVSEALKSIPAQSQFYQCISDVIKWHKQYPTDWKTCWFEAQKKWTDEVGCPDGVFKPFNIDAKINAAYIVIGLLYGNGDFGKTVDISTRCGFDSDCNPANAAGILATMIGYSNIPAYWKQGLNKVENINFPYTSMSLNTVYQVGLKHALENIVANGGSEQNGSITIKPQEIVAAPLEVCSENCYPILRDGLWKTLDEKSTSATIPFKGNGFVITGTANKTEGVADKDLYAEVFVDGALVEKAKLTTNWLKRRHEITWKYNLSEGNHTAEIKLLNATKGYNVKLDELLVYSSEKPLKTVYY